MFDRSVVGHDLMQALIALEEKVDAFDCFCRVVGSAAGDDSPDWLWSVGRLLSDVRQDLSPVSTGVRLLLKTKGEGPRSGEGKALSGAEAERREGVQPPVDRASNGEVSE